MKMTLQIINMMQNVNIKVIKFSDKAKLIDF